MVRSAGSPKPGRVILDWEAAVEPALQAPVTMVIGDSDTGKTTLVTALANALRAGGASVAALDADLGQSEIGPPTTVGLGRVTHPLARLSEAELLALHFVGVTSPAANPLGTLVGCHRMLMRARALGGQRVVIDTSGLVRGELGRMLKQGKIDLLDPDLLIAVERVGECEPIVRPYLTRGRPLVLRLPAAAAVRRRSAAERRRHREARWQAWFANAQSVQLDLRRVVMRQPPLFVGHPLQPQRLATAAGAAGSALLWGEQRADAVVVVSDQPLGLVAARAVAASLGRAPLIHYARQDFEGTLAGLDDASGQTLGVGLVRRIDFVERVLSVETSVEAKAVASVALGREKYVRPEPGRR
jgi:polynucleotide 5'-hydroxyl-kinase GRC3/NOL9